jgi:exodeoxyribonuclease V beta subunit
MTELGLRIPVAGVQLIEASAGTGKTFTVATLYTRLVIELGLPVAKLLAVTYTEAAAKDLRDKLRERLARAALLLEGEDLPAATDAGGADALTLALLQAALARGETLGALRQRLRAAVAQMDMAPIHTIHAFCQRALREHALEAGQPLAARTLVTNEAALRREVATEFWRRQSGDDDAVERLLGVWKSPQELAESLPDLLGYDLLLPARAEVDLRQARGELAAAFIEHGQAAYEELLEAGAGRQINITISRESALEPVWTALHRWLAAPLAADPRIDKLASYGARALREKTLKNGVTPANPLFAAIDEFLAAQSAARSALVHEAVAFARRRLAELKRERQLIGFDDLIREVDEAIQGEGGGAFVRALRRQYQVALVDEFQDTDPRQWRIFHRLFAQPELEDEAAPRALFLIGDPKQAIYRFRGGDVATYLAAQREAGGRHRLERNFRSRPLALQAIAALFELGGAGAFRQAGIEFEPVTAGGDCLDAHFLRDGAPARALVLQQFALPAKASIEQVRTQCAANCVAAIHQLLSEAQQGRAQIGVRQPDGTLTTRPLRPADISVLVARNKDALRMQRALSEAGIPSVAAGRASLYDSAEARDLRAWLAALAAPADDGRLRALLATPLFGLDAAAIAAFDTDLARHRHWQDALQHWLAHASRRGAMAALAVVCAQESARLLAQAGGERRLSNYLQLVEELQAAEAGAIGISGLLAELERRIEDADENNDAELLRLESDSARVRIMTMHLSKGLNLDLVFLPFAALMKPLEGKSRKPRLAGGHDGLARVGHLVRDGKDPACAEEAGEVAAEYVRVLYVALTRARYATWIGWGQCKDALKTPLAWLLHRGADGSLPKSVNNLQAEAALSALLARAPQAIELQAAVDPGALAALPRLQFQSPDTLPPARVAQRQLDRDWWVYSFSQLAREDSGAEDRGAEDEVEPPPLQRSRFSGTRFGNALHGALEAIRFADWRDWRDVHGPLPPPHQLEPVREALRREGFGSEADLEEGLPILSALIAETLNAPMPEGTRLATLAPEAMCVEMEFHFELAPVQVSALLQLLHRHGVLPERRSFGLRTRLEGLLTGRIDLVYEAQGRFYVLDYKSNQLPDYQPDTLARAVRESEYDLQYVLYTLALHRWLRFRLGAAYDLATHLGGVRYVFCRGLDRDDASAPGIHALRLPDALVLELDALLRREAA